jgi:hypothetical protein
MSVRIALIAALVAALPVSADDASEKRKKVASENLAKGEIAKAATVETDDLIVCAPLTEAKTKTLADAMQKSHALARKVLQIDEKDNLWGGKLTVYYLPESRAFKNFIRSVALSKPEDAYHFSLTGDAPYVVESGDAGDKATENEQFGAGAGRVAVAVLEKKMGPTLPEWVKGGFGRAVSLRAEGTNSKRYAAYKTATRRVVLGGAGRAPSPVADAWEGKGKDGELVATSVMEYVTFAPTAGAGLKFINGFRPTEDVQTPGVANALEAAKWKQETLDAAWKKWVQAGK